MDSFPRLTRLLLGAVCLVGFAGSASATAVPLTRVITGFVPAAGGGWSRNPYESAGQLGARAWSVMGPKVVATDTLVLAGRAGSLPIGAAMSVSAGDAALAVARCLAGGGPICALGTAAAAAYAVYGVSRGSGGGLLGDPGTAPVSTPRLCVINSEYTYVPRTYCGTEESIMNQVQALIAEEGWPYISFPAVPGYVQKCDFTGACYQGSVYFVGEVPSSGCPASIDASNPANNIPAGSAPYPDGSCPTGRYNHAPITPEAAAARAAGAAPASWLNPLRDSIDSGGQSVPADMQTSGPATQTGSPLVSSTSSSSDGSTTQTTTTPTYNYSYGGDTINYNTTNVTVTTTTNNAGAVSTTTTTSTPPAAAPQDPTDPCTANPSRLGCQPAPDPSTFSARSLGAAATVLCTGDAIQCAIAREQAVRACQFFDATNPAALAGQKASVDGVLGDADHPGRNVQAVQVGGGFDQTDIVTGACIQDKVVQIAGRSVLIEFSLVCGPAEWLGNFLVGLTGLACLFIAFKRD